MDNFWDKRRKVYGTEEIPDDMEVITAKEWSKRNGYSLKHTQKLFKAKRVKNAYKSNRLWYVVVPKLR